MMKRRKQHNTSSKCEGVTFNKACNTWHARLQLDQQMKHLGFYDNEKEAAAKYNEVAMQLFGEYALLK